LPETSTWLSIRPPTGLPTLLARALGSLGGLLMLLMLLAAGCGSLAAAVPARCTRRCGRHSRMNRA
jgi:hypothetical protein